MTGAEAAKLAFEGRWVYRKAWRGYGWHDQFVTDVELLARQMAQEHSWEGIYGLTQFKVTVLEFWEGEMGGSDADLLPIREDRLAGR